MEDPCIPVSSDADFVNDSRGSGGSDFRLMYCLSDKCDKGFKNMKQVQNYMVTAVWIFGSTTQQTKMNIINIYLNLHSLNEECSEQQLKTNSLTGGKYYVVLATAVMYPS